MRASSLVGEDDDQDDPPETRTPEWSWSTRWESAVVEKDALNDKQIANSVGEPFFPTWPVPIPVLHISRLQLSFDATWKVDYEGK